MGKNVKISKNYRQYVILPPNWVPRGDLFCIPIKMNSSIFRLLTVTHGQGLMPIKNNALLINKQHPTLGPFRVGTGLDWVGIGVAIKIVRYLDPPNLNFVWRRPLRGESNKGASLCEDDL